VLKKLLGKKRKQAAKGRSLQEKEGS
jgi:hypothetical protein